MNEQELEELVKRVADQTMSPQEASEAATLLRYSVLALFAGHRYQISMSDNIALMANRIRPTKQDRALSEGNRRNWMKYSDQAILYMESLRT